MMCYKDKTFCSFWVLCKDAGGCGRVLTDKVRDEAKKAGLPISQFMDFPECFRVIWGRDEDS